MGGTEVEVEDGLALNVLVVRSNDDTGGWVNVADGTLERRYHYCQRWRTDVSAIVGGMMMVCGNYSSYGVPIGLAAGDGDSGGSGGGRMEVRR